MFRLTSTYIPYQPARLKPAEERAATNIFLTIVVSITYQYPYFLKLLGIEIANLL
jgi:hypothetical protein